MSSAVFVVLNKEEPGFDSQVNGKTVARHYESLENLAKKLGVAALSDFESMDPAEAMDFMEDEGVDTSGMDVPAEQWFKPADGLKAIRALIEHLEGKGKRTKGAKEVVEDLRGFEEVLAASQKKKLKFHFQWDF